MGASWSRYDEEVIWSAIYAPTLRRKLCRATFGQARDLTDTSVRVVTAGGR